MANIKSAKKRILVIEKKTLRNKMIKSKIKTVIKKLEAAIAANDKELAKERLAVVISEIDTDVIDEVERMVNNDEETSGWFSHNKPI